VGRTRLPLFPLQVVLFPGSRLPLHIFEERYKVLVNSCIREEKEFGIVLEKSDGLADVGCTASILSVLKVYGDGRMDIVVEGRRRFKIHRLETERAPYLVGEVEYLDAVAEPVDESLVAETIRLYNAVVALVYKGKVDAISPVSQIPDVSFLIVQKAGMDLSQRQHMLEIQSEAERLQLLRDYLQAVLPKIEQAGEIERIVRGDGYLPRVQSPEDE